MSMVKWLKCWYAEVVGLNSDWITNISLSKKINSYCYTQPRCNILVPTGVVMVKGMRNSYIMLQRMRPNDLRVKMLSWMSMLRHGYQGINPYLYLYFK